jgi:hypothetical protein
VKMTTLLKAIYMFTIAPSKSQWHSSQKYFLKFWNSYGSTHTHKKQLASNSEQKSILDYRLHYRTMVTESAWYWHKNKHIYQCNRTEDPEISPHSYRHLIWS